MSYKNLLIAFAILAAVLAPLSGASTVTLNGGCPLALINSSKSFITFVVNNSGNGVASDMLISANFPGIDPRNMTVVIPNVEPGSTYTEQFHLSKLIGKGSYAVNINATYVQAGSNYATVFPCIIYIGSLAGGPLQESLSVNGSRMSVNVINTAPQSIEAQVDAVVPPSFSAHNATRAVTVSADGHAAMQFVITSPKYSDASFPLISELSYEYNGTHYAQMGSVAFVFGQPTAQTAIGGTGIGLMGFILIAVVILILILIIASLVVKHKKRGDESKKVHAEKAKMMRR